MIRKIGRHLDILKYSWRLSRSRKQPLVPTFKRAMWLYREKRFFADEAFDLGLLQLDGDPELFDGVVSRRSQAQIQRKINPISWAPALSDKGLFYRFCEAADLAVPELYALYFKTTPGYCSVGVDLHDQQQWIEYVSTVLPHEFIVKPCVSYGGSGVVGFTRTSPGVFSSSLGRDMTARQIVEFMRDYRDADSFVLQERLRSHSSLAALTNNSNLQTVRITTYMDRGMNCRLLFSFMKLMTQETTIIDNIGTGRNGNLLNKVCTETGRIVESYVKTRNGTGNQPISHHPVTERPLTGFQIPHWDEARDLVHRAARLFLPVRSVGWDVAITDDGVKLLEGNIWWDRLSHDCNYIGTILKDLDGPQA